MRYPLAGSEMLSGITKGGGVVAMGLGLAAGVAKRALGPVALPMALGSGLLWLGRTMGDAFVEIGGEDLHIKLGALFDEKIPLADIRGVERSEWALLGGLGVRSNLRDLVAVTTRSGPAAKIALWKPYRLPILPRIWYISATHVVVTPDDLDDFIGELDSRLRADDSPASE